MSSIRFLHDSSLISGERIAELGRVLAPEIKKISAAWGAGYETEYASLSLPSDTSLHKTIQEAIQEKKELKPAALAVVGIGGSSLGTKAVLEALTDHAPLKIYFPDTVDDAYISEIYQQLEQELKTGNNILITVISKSGTTTETVANAQLFIDLLQKYKRDNYHQYLVFITDKDSKLWRFAHEHHSKALAIPKLVGGRYSVFSAVGLFPLGMSGIDYKALAAGAQSMKEECTNKSIEKNQAALSAAILYDHYKNGINIHDTFLFSVALRGFGDWYRQLMAESIGKEKDRDGQIVHVGITPTISIGTNDLHSVAQLYLGGPYDKFTTFITAAQKNNLPIPNGALLDELAPELKHKTYSMLMQAIEQGVQIAYKKNERPFISIELPEISAYSMGQLLQFKMVEIIYLGYLLQVNPFDQPQVELYKKETREILNV